MQHSKIIIIIKHYLYTDLDFVVSKKKKKKIYNFVYHFLDVYNFV